MTQPLEGKPLLVAEPKLPLPYLNSLTCSVPFLRKEPPESNWTCLVELEEQGGGTASGRYWQVVGIGVALGAGTPAQGPGS